MELLIFRSERLDPPALSLLGALLHRQRNVALICLHPGLFNRKAAKQNCYNPLIQGVHLELARIYFLVRTRRVHRAERSRLVG